MPGDARKRRKVSKVFGGFRVLYHKRRRKTLAGLSESLEHIPGRLQRGGRVPQRQARLQRVVRGALSQCLSQGRRTARVRQQPDLGRRDLRLAVRERVAGRDRMSPRREHRHSDRTGAEQPMFDR